MSSEEDFLSAKMEGAVKLVEGQYHDKEPSISSAVYSHNSSSKIESTATCSRRSVMAKDVPSEPKVVGGTTGNTSTTTQLSLQNFQFRVRKVKNVPKDSSRSHSLASSSNNHGQVTEPSNKDSQHNLQSISIEDDKKNCHSAINPTLSNRVHGSIRVYPTPSSTGQVKQFSDSFGMREFYGSKKIYEASHDAARGPRSNKMINSSSLCEEKSRITDLIHRDHYNKSDFQTNYEHAKFFMIKSFNEVDVHKSVKYNVWASTAYGNKKLENAFRAAETVKMEKGTNCPVFLFFSVNASGQFVGLAEMLGPVDFNKSMSFWEEEIWTGFFPLKWHIIKDIPNRLFQSIILENNDNKAVTFSRDTQEIGLPQGLRMLDIFKGYQSRTSILDDFEYYESKEKELRKSKISQDNSYVGGSSLSLNTHNNNNSNKSFSTTWSRPRGSVGSLPHTSLWKHHSGR